MPMGFSNHILVYSDVRIEISHFQTTEGVHEYHAMLHVTTPEAPFEKQLRDIRAAYFYLLASHGNEVRPVFRRYFLSDAANQVVLLQNGEQPYPPCATSIVQQPPLDGSKIALWVYLQSDMEICPRPDGIVARHNGVSHLWCGHLISPEGEASHQTETLLQYYTNTLSEENCRLEEHCIRTWFFVQNVDVNYGAVVNARRTVFERHNLTPKTHYITSTGIEGRQADPACLVALDAYAVHGLKPEQQQILYARTHLNPTYEYGVTFERGIRIEYGDRSHIFLSGTASIDHCGNIVAPGDIQGQIDRMLENIKALLAEAEAGEEDLAQIIVYLRDPGDYPTVKACFEKRYAHIPGIIVWAPVCRPGWLIEMEGIAIKERNHPEFAPL